MKKNTMDAHQKSLEERLSEISADIANASDQTASAKMILQRSGCILKNVQQKIEDLYLSLEDDGMSVGESSEH